LPSEQSHTIYSTLFLSSFSTTLSKTIAVSLKPFTISTD